MNALKKQWREQQRREKEKAAMENATEACIEWTKRRDRKGFGRTYLDGKSTPAHRAVWIRAHGEIPNGKIIRQRCGNHGCVNIEHLVLGVRAGVPYKNKTPAESRAKQPHPAMALDCRMGG